MVGTFVPTIFLHFTGWDRSSRTPPTRPTDFNPPTLGGVGPMTNAKLTAALLFQSSHPGWGGTVQTTDLTFQLIISILPPWVGWDSDAAYDLSS